MKITDLEPEKPSWQSSPWFASILLSFIAALFYSDRTAFTTLFPLLKDNLGFSDMGLAAINTFYLWSFALASPLAGFLGDRFSRRSLILVSIFFWSVITMVSSVVTSSTQLLALRILLGLTECLFVPNAVALLGEYHPVRSRALAMGLFVSGINLGLVAGGTIAGGLGESYGWRSAILALGFTGLPVLGISYALLKEKPHRTEQKLLPDSHATPIWSNLGEVMKIPSFWVLTLGGIFLNFGSWVFLNWLPLYFQEDHHMGLAASGFSANAYTTLGAVLGMMVGGYLSDWVTKHGLHHRLLQEALWIGVCFPFPLFFVSSSRLYLIFLSIFAFTLFRSMGAANATPLYCEVLRRNTWASAFGFVNMVNSIAAGIGVVMAGYFKQRFGLNLIFAAVSGIMLMAVIVLIVGYISYIKSDLERQGHVIPSG
jgi:predicted MFS family arabinose efflux permease